MIGSLKEMLKWVRKDREGTYNGVHEDDDIVSGWCISARTKIS